MHSTRLALCAAALLLAASDPAEAARRRAWVTSVSGNGNLASWPDAGGLSGLAAGDAICRARANAEELPNANAYRAWLSTTTTDAYCHIQGLTGQRATGCNGGTPAPAGPWFGVGEFGGVIPATENLDRLLEPEGAIYRSLRYDESGQSVHDDPPTLYWTGTSTQGTVSGTANCSDWSSPSGGLLGITGSTRNTAQLWTAGYSVACNEPRRLLCLEPGPSEPTGQTWRTPGSIAFLTSAYGTGELGLWFAAGTSSGIEAGDAICRNLAAAAHLPAPDSFVAWLSDSTVDARDRVLSDGPFRRIDGVTVASSKADLIDGSPAGSLHQREDGTYLIGHVGGLTWTGTLPDGTGAEDCDGWTSNDSESLARYGKGASQLSSDWTNYLASYGGCNHSFLHLYCFSNVVTIFWDGFESADTGRWSGEPL